MIAVAAEHKIPRVFVHAITDGRDASPAGSLRYLPELQQVLDSTGTGQIATVTGRYYAMDRDNRWERTKLAYDAIVGGVSATPAANPLEAIRASYAAGVTDEFITPIVVVQADGAPVGPIRDGDSVVFFNFRADRARQLTRAIAFQEFDGFERGSWPRVHYTTMTAFDRTFGLPVVFEPQSFSGNFADVLAAHGRSNLRLAETEKYAHVTYFFNCGREEPYPAEERLLIPSQKHVPTYDLMPEMSAPGIANALVADIAAGTHDVVICNFANADMVGHTGQRPRDDCGGRDARSLSRADHERRAESERNRHRDR